MTRARLLAALAAGSVAAGAAAVPDAFAGQIVWQKGGTGGGIWVMDDNGQNQRPLISTADASGMSHIGAPHLHPLGGQTIVFTGSTSDNNVTLGSRTYAGNNAIGIYRWDAGAATRLTAPPSRCSTGTTACTTYERDPEAAADGTYVFQKGIVGGNGSSSDFHDELGRGSLATGASSEFPTQCSSGSNLGNAPESPSPNPANPAEVAYIGCTNPDPAFPNAVWIKTDSGTPTAVVETDAALADPSWRLDGSGVLVVLTGAPNTGIWLASRDGATARKVVDDGSSSNPRDLGDRILFESGGELYTVPATCDGCTLANATKLTTGGDNVQPAWTSAASFPAPGPANPGPGSGGPDGGGAGADTTAPTVRATFSRRLRLRGVLGSGLPIGLNLSEAGTVTASVTVDGRTARRYRLVTGSRARSLVVGRASAHMNAGRGTIRVRIARKHARKLRRARTLRLRVSVTAIDAAGNAATTRRTLTVRR